MSERKPRSWTEVSLSAIGKNIRAIRRRVGKAEIYAVIKADAYGHGALETASLLANSGVDTFCVATLDEAAALRQAGFERQRIILLGAFYPDEIGDLFELNLIPCLSDSYHLEKLSRYCKKKDLSLEAHLKINTGMNRYGFGVEELTKGAGDIFRTPGITISSLFSHLAASSQASDQGTQDQISGFINLVDYLEISNFWFGKKHLANSGGILYYRDSYLNAVRPGLILYGYYPGEIDRPRLSLTPALRFYSRVIAVKKLAAGESLGYERSFRATKEMTIALISLGYADGYPLSLSNKGVMLLGRESCPVVGRVCMDTTMIHVPSGRVKPGDQVLIWGGRELPLENIAQEAGSIPYELVTQITSRVTRLHVD